MKNLYINSFRTTYNKLSWMQQQRWNYTGNTEGEKGGETANLVIYQNKVEVTTPLQAYADKWGAENNAKVTVKKLSSQVNVTMELV